MTDRYVPIEDIEVPIQEAYAKGMEVGAKAGADARTKEFVAWLRDGKATVAMFGSSATDKDYDDFEALADLVEELWRLKDVSTP